MRESRERAFAISTSCCWAVLSRSTRRLSGSDTPRSWKIAATLDRASGQLIVTPPDSGRWPMSTFSATVRWGQSTSSW